MEMEIPEEQHDDIDFIQLAKNTQWTFHQDVGDIIIIDGISYKIAFDGKKHVLNKIKQKNDKMES